MILKVIRSCASRIQTYNISLSLLVLLVYQRMQFSRLGIPNDVRLNSNLFDDSAADSRVAGWLLLKCSAIGIGFNGAETNCGIARILGILLMNSL